MTQQADYISKNRELWNKRTAYHMQSDFYDVKGFLEGRSSLSDIELAMLGNSLEGKTVLHLQCHFGQDSLSMARMGAKVTGVDLSDKAIDEAKRLNTQLNLGAEFICCDIYDLPDLLTKKFDIVFTSFGTIGWLPDMDRWATVVGHFLKPGGRFVFAEFHPVVWMFDNDFTKVAYDYFNSGPIIEVETGTYADKSAPITTESVSWNHSLGEVVSALLKQDLTLTSFKEYNYSPYNCFSGTEQIGENKFRIRHLAKDIPMVYSLVAEKR
jgi:2-polyprenyl-3-methyl-5-hydroxy-6-metoxy-1,4-benzoquinol methylase